MAAVAVLTGPFGTFSDLTILERLVYWPLALAGVATTMIVVVHQAHTKMFQSLHPVLRIAIGSFVAAPIGAAFLLTLDVLVRGEAFTPCNLAFRWMFVFLIGFGVAVVESHVRPMHQARMREEVGQEPANDDDEAPEPPLFVRNLDPTLGTELISITTKDHYLDVVTSKGEDRILKRMSDALAELNGFPGLQIHRSHWVALDAIDRVEREGRKCQVVLKNGKMLPVSRPNIPVVTEALERR